MAKFQRSSASPTTAAFDRGPAEYFHGREKILKNFNELTKKAVAAKGGTTFLIQGAPGAGKTALLDQCGKLAKGSGWEIAEINPPALWDPDELLYCLGKGANLQVTGGSGTVGVDTVIKAEAKFDVAVKRLSLIMVKILQDVKKPLLLILDEAQSLGIKDVVPSDRKGIVNSVLNNIHNGSLKKPVLLLVAGLGTTGRAFESLGISRIAENCFVELGVLNNESERAVIRDWLKKEGRAKGDPTTWIDVIVQETQGWPRHIQSYSNHAADHLEANGGIMTPPGLNVVLKNGREGRKVYYMQRVKDFDGDEVLCLSEAIADIGPGMPFNKELVKEPLIRNYGPDEANQLFRKFLEKGVIAADGFLYSVPIPSMHDWMKSELERTQERLRVLKET